MLPNRELLKRTIHYILILTHKQFIQFHGIASINICLLIYHITDEYNIYLHNRMKQSTFKLQNIKFQIYSKYHDILQDFMCIVKACTI